MKKLTWKRGSAEVRIVRLDSPELQNATRQSVLRRRNTDVTFERAVWPSKSIIHFEWSFHLISRISRSRSSCNHPVLWHFTRYRHPAIAVRAAVVRFPVALRSCHLLDLLHDRVDGHHLFVRAAPQCVRFHGETIGRRCCADIQSGLVRAILLAGAPLAAVDCAVDPHGCDFSPLSVRDVSLSVVDETSICCWRLVVVSFKYVACIAAEVEILLMPRLRISHEFL